MQVRLSSRLLQLTVFRGWHCVEAKNDVHMSVCSVYLPQHPGLEIPILGPQKEDFGDSLPKIKGESFVTPEWHILA